MGYASFVTREGDAGERRSKVKFVETLDKCADPDPRLRWRRSRSASLEHPAVVYHVAIDLEDGEACANVRVRRMVGYAVGGDGV